MAVATAVFTQSAYPRGQDMTQRRMLIYGTLAIIASPATYPAGGIPVTYAANSSNQGGIDFPGFSRPGAIRATLDSRNGSGFLYFWTTVDKWTSLYKGNLVAVGQSLQDPNGNIQTCTTAGTAGSGTEPVWAIPTAATPNPTTTDGTVTWTCEGPSSGLVQIFEQNGTTGALVELSQASSIPSGVSGDTISAVAEFQKG